MIFIITNFIPSHYTNSKHTLQHIKPKYIESYRQAFKLPMTLHHFPMPLNFDLLPYISTNSFKLFAQ